MPPDESRYVIVDGHVLKRVAGGEIDQGGSAPTAVQPGAEEAPSQGREEGTTEGLYDLSAAPEELRPLLEEELKKVTRNVDAKFREHAEFRERFEPLADIEGLTDVPPEELQELLQFRQTVGDPEQFDPWVHDILVAIGQQDRDRAGTIWASIGEKLGLFEDDGEPGAGPAGESEDEPQWAKDLRSEIDELKQGQGQQAQAAREAAASEAIQDELDSLSETHQEKYGEELDTDAVRRFAYYYDGGDDAIQKGYEDYLRFSGKAQSELVGDALEQPAAANGGGRPDTSTEPVKTFEDARKAAMQRLGAGSPT